MTQVLSEIYQICELHNHETDSDKCKAIVDLLINNLHKEKIIIPQPSGKWSFMTALNHQRHNNSDVNLNQLVSDGEKVYNQYLSNQNKEYQLNDFRHKMAFTNYKKQIPSSKYIKTKNGYAYNVDDLVQLIINNSSTIEPSDIQSRHYLWNSDAEENLIIGHPGLSDELREEYILHKKYKIEQQDAIYTLLSNNMSILTSIGEYGAIFLNIGVNKQKFKYMLTNLIDIIGNSEDNPILRFEILEAKTIFTLIKDFIDGRVSHQELGYYLILIYLKFYHICNTKQSIPLLPIFRNFSNNCDKTLYCGTVVIPLLQLDCNTTDTIQSLEKKNTIHRQLIFVWVPSEEPNKLIITENILNNQDLREDMSAIPQSSSPIIQSYINGMKLDDLCPELIHLIDQDTTFSTQNLLALYKNIYTQKECKINN